MRRNFKPLGLAAAVADILGAGGIYGPMRIIRKGKPTKDCLQCGTPHQHNNSFCSGDCCRAHRAGE